MSENDPQLTPAMKQYYDMKNEYSDAILFFRMGDFYEMFDEDAHIAHKVLGVAITTRNKNSLTPTPLAGIPYHAKEKYLPLLVEAGYKVAIAEQVSDPKLKGIVKREVVRIVTPATLHLEGEEYSKNIPSSFIVSITQLNDTFGVSFLDLTDNAWFASEFLSYDKMASEVYKISPREVILDKKLFIDSDVKNLFLKKQNLNIYYFEPGKSPKKTLIDHFGVSSLDGFGLEKKQVAIMASSLLLEYININQKNTLSFLREIRFESFSDCLEIDEATMQNLDIVFNFSTKSKSLGTLLGLLDKTHTSMGRRKLHHAIVRPLKDISHISERHKIIDELLHNKLILDQITSKLRYVSDIDAILNRLALGRASTKDLLLLKRSLQMIQEVYTVLEKSELSFTRKYIFN